MPVPAGGEPRADSSDAPYDRWVLTPPDPDAATLVPGDQDDWSEGQPNVAIEPRINEIFIAPPGAPPTPTCTVTPTPGEESY